MNVEYVLINHPVIIKQDNGTLLKISNRTGEIYAHPDFLKLSLLMRRFSLLQCIYLKKRNDEIEDYKKLVERFNDADSRALRDLTIIESFDKDRFIKELKEVFFQGGNKDLNKIRLDNINEQLK